MFVYRLPFCGNNIMKDQNDTISCILNFSIPNTAWGIPFGIISVLPFPKMYSLPPTVNFQFAVKHRYYCVAAGGVR